KRGGVGWGGWGDWADPRRTDAPDSPQRVEAQAFDLSLDRGRQFDAARVAPGPFETVKVAGRLVKDVHDDIVIVEHDPVRMVKAFDRERAPPVLDHPLFDSARDGLHLHLRPSGRNQKVIRDR